MQILAIDRFKNEKYQKEASKFLEENHTYILDLYNRGIVRAFWSRKDNILLVYVSAATNAMKESTFESILESSRKNNKNLGISRMLLYHNGSFLQVLEGSEDRVFEDWSMGRVDATQEDIQTIEGLNDFFLDGSCYTDISENQVKEILSAFKDGKWRQKIS